ncbi:hypothetical protein DUI87_24653 [Hirundo rustica rustica]|uniref:Uncharacterized protein n=1 Tax=Hirundo rustica rustica TaxID=333673 RepID=A0A3M0JI78_HIRRU|nr:hypothetical protein DUI87_24653 [Hirundo rustica rustica]
MVASVLESMGSLEKQALLHEELLRLESQGVSQEVLQRELKRDVICQGEAEQPLKGPVGNPGITVSISDVCLPGSSGFDWRAGT